MLNSKETDYSIGEEINLPVDPNGNEKKYKANQQSYWTKPKIY